MGPITLALIVVQLQVARMAVVTGKGFAELIREEFGVRWTAVAMLVLIVANGTVTIAEFAGIAAGRRAVRHPAADQRAAHGHRGVADRGRAPRTRSPRRSSFCCPPRC